MDSGDNFSFTDVSKQQNAILAWLFKVAPGMERIDQILQWLADTVVRSFSLQLMQLWAGQMDARGQALLQLRAQSSQDATLPQQVVVNNDIGQAVQQMIGKQGIYSAQPVETLFSRYRAALLTRYGLSYCAGSFTDAPFFLPPDASGGSSGSGSPLAISTLVFTSQRPQVNLMPAIDHVVKQAIVIAGKRGIIVPMSVGRQATPIPPSQPYTFPLPDLIPQRRQEADILLLNNPFGGSAVINDKRARRIHALIDGHTTIAALCKNSGMNVKEVYGTLLFLLRQQRIDLRTPDGHLIDPALLPDTL